MREKGITPGEGKKEKKKSIHSLVDADNNPEFFLHVNLLAGAG